MGVRMCMESMDTEIQLSCAVSPAKVPDIEDLLMPLLVMLNTTSALGTSQRAIMDRMGALSALHSLALDEYWSTEFQLYALFWCAADKLWLTYLKRRVLTLP